MEFNCIENLKKSNSYIHNITNYVTSKICADIQYASGVKAIMADEIDEVAEITSKCDCLNLNIGTLNKNTLKSMIISGKTANENDIPIVLDPAGIGCSNFRKNSVQEMLDNFRISCICANLSEIKTLLNTNYTTNGVDANNNDFVNKQNAYTAIEAAKELSSKLNCTVVISGEIDVVANEDNTYLISNGCSQMGKIVGSGCGLSALIAALISANPDDILQACVQSCIYFGVAGQLAAKDKFEYSTFQNKIIDLISSLSLDEIKK